MTPAPLTAIAAIEKAMSEETRQFMQSLVDDASLEKTKRKVAEKEAEAMRQVSIKNAQERNAYARKAEALERENAELREALKPFAMFAENFSLFKHRFFLQLLVCPDGDDHPEDYRPHFRRARTLLKDSADANG